jgi:hypothetical protein
MSSGRNGGRPAGRIDVSLWGISDAELLGIINDLADEQGWVNTLNVRLQLGENPEDSTEGARSGVGPRLSWLTRYGWLERGERQKDEDGHWWQTYRLTPMGQLLLEGPQLTAAFEKTLGKLNPRQRLQLTRELGEAGAGAPDEIRTAIRRQWVRSLGRGR